MISNNFCTHILLKLRQKTENHSGSYQKDHQQQLKKLTHKTNFILHSYLLTQFCCARYSESSTLKISEANKSDRKYANRRLKSRFSHLVPMISQPNKWLMKLIKMKRVKTNKRWKKWKKRDYKSKRKQPLWMMKIPYLRE